MEADGSGQTTIKNVQTLKPTETSSSIPSSTSSSIPESTPTPVPDLEVDISTEEGINILPENKFSDMIPSLEKGELGAMEISKSSVNYNINNVSNDIYENYINKIKEFGYIKKDDIWVKDNNELKIEYDDGSINLSLFNNNK